MPITDLQEELAGLQQHLQNLPYIEETPLTTLQILRNERQEKSWQRLLTYFLDPGEPHGLDDRALHHFLDALTSREMSFTFSRLDLRDVQVEQEVGTDQGRPDLLIYVPEEWFLCIELKIDSSEGADQTQRYVEAERFTGLNMAKSAYPDDGHHYLYIAPDDARQPKAKEFIHLPWEWVATEIETFLANSQGKYPSRTTAQLLEFISTIHSETIMTEYKQNQWEKIELAIEYQDAIDEVTAALAEYVDDLQATWPNWFLEHDPFEENNSWETLSSKNSYAKVIRPHWTRNLPEGETDLKYSDFGVNWLCIVRDKTIKKGEVVHRITATGKDHTLLTTFCDTFYSDDLQQQLTNELAKLNSSPGKEVKLREWEDSKTYHTLIESTYEFNPNRGEGFEQTAATAFRDLQPVFKLVSEAIPER